MNDLRSLVDHQTQLLVRSTRLLAELGREMRAVTAASLSCGPGSCGPEMPVESAQPKIISLQDARFRISA